MGLGLGLCVGLSVGSLSAQAADEPAPPQTWNAHGQATYVWQDQSAMAARYSGPHSLSAQHADSYSFTATLALGWRPWRGGEVYLNPEAAQGRPLSELSGLGGLSNGEMGRSSGPRLKPYRARLFWRQTWGEAGDTEAVGSAANQLAGTRSSERWVLTVGNLSVLDIFDGNAYSHDPRTQFLNWSLMTHGAYDYAGDARGYTTGVALERYLGDWALRAGRFMLPEQPNGQALDIGLLHHMGDQIELEHAHTWQGQPGRLRAQAFRNRAVMSRFTDALSLAEREARTPDIDAVRTRTHSKFGWGLSLEQAIGPDVGVFARHSWADGQTENVAFTEIDRSLSGGVLLQGRRWQRPGDTWGIALARNGLSSAHQRYLAAGGLGFFLGDGALRYAPEQIVETFYSLALCKGAWLSADWQHIRHPAYNADRGPVRITSLRLHTEL